MNNRRGVPNGLITFTCSLSGNIVANCADTIIELQSQLNSISGFCNKSRMSSNENVNEIIVFKNDGPISASSDFITGI